MDVFDLRDRVVGQYEEYVRSFVTVKEPTTRAFVDTYLGDGKLWPEPLVQLNPSFEPGAIDLQKTFWKFASASARG